MFTEPLIEFKPPFFLCLMYVQRDLFPKDDFAHQTRSQELLIHKRDSWMMIHAPCELIWWERNVKTCHKLPLTVPIYSQRVNETCLIIKDELDL